MMRILETLPDRFEVCYEASSGYGHYHDLLSPIAARLTVAHPGRLRRIFRSKDKNDRKDAERLAKLLYLGEAPAVHVPAADVRTWRSAIVEFQTAPIPRCYFSLLLRVSIHGKMMAKRIAKRIDVSQSIVLAP
jgi:hypothetical protein